LGEVGWAVDVWCVASQQRSTKHITLRADTDFYGVFTFKVNAVPTQVDSPAAQVRSSKASTGTLILDLTTYIAQAVPGVMVISVPRAITAALPPGNYYWDMFGTVGSSRIKLVDVSVFTVYPAVTADDAP
jgi:hypothetical protein